jgi:DUF177 domain-containing protein
VEAKISEGGDFKNNDLHPIHFDRGGNQPYYTRPMAPALPDRVDCEHLADNSVVLERVYSLGEMPRLQDLLAGPQGSVRASFSFAKVDSGRVGATVAIESIAQLVCQRCLQSFAFPLTGSSEIEFAGNLGPGAAESQREVYAMDDGSVSLRELAEEELLLALPIVAMHEPQECEQAAIEETDGEIQGMLGDRTRPFASLKNLLKKT